MPPKSGGALAKKKEMDELKRQLVERGRSRELVRVESEARSRRKKAVGRKKMFERVCETEGDRGERVEEVVLPACFCSSPGAC